MLSYPPQLGLTEKMSDEFWETFAALQLGTNPTLCVPARRQASDHAKALQICADMTKKLQEREHLTTVGENLEPDEQPFRFLDLPVELRLMVYRRIQSHTHCHRILLKDRNILCRRLKDTLNDEINVLNGEGLSRAELGRIHRVMEILSGPGFHGSEFVLDTHEMNGEEQTRWEWVDLLIPEAPTQLLATCCLINREATSIISPKRKDVADLRPSIRSSSAFAVAALTSSTGLLTAVVDCYVFNRMRCDCGPKTTWCRSLHPFESLSTEEMYWVRRIIAFIFRKQNFPLDPGSSAPPLEDIPSIAIDVEVECPDDPMGFLAHGLVLEKLQTRFRDRSIEKLVPHRLYRLSLGFGFSSCWSSLTSARHLA
ncbi:hypothetical protein BU23DRAFT_600066 [Bimuria novae-zelandiae CBS 107.79]|uniref:Uncharacterized protein n=1 Tax=Bimuria novae-zelandiae CBS 107.79 TaxID=1447943 RepID=A0A6A5V3L1_9PLEO|nr:hypothetical protein BU23DRAFT_600066 [Bimuria novae-zelandiae CBS 107.79]